MTTDHATLKEQRTYKTALEELESRGYYCNSRSLKFDAAFIWLKNEASLDIVCPFCGEGDFDTIGLKNHYERGHCDFYNGTKLPERRPYE
jgi:hypothetical protein